MVDGAKKFCDHAGLHPEIRRLLKGHKEYMYKMRCITTGAEKALSQGCATALIRIWCNWGKHQSVALAANAAEVLKAQGYTVTVTHLARSQWPVACKEGTCGVHIEVAPAWKPWK